MSHQRKKRSIILDQAQACEAAVTSLGSELDLGDGLTLEAYGQLIAQTREALATYNTLLARLDQTYLNFKALEQCLIDMSEGVLTGMATHYGQNSTEYEMANGTDDSEQQCSRPQSETDIPDLAKD